jgi:hypothetical protein
MSIVIWEHLIVFLGGLATLAIFSFLIKENLFYRFFEHLFIGIAAGIGTILAFKNFLWPKVLIPLLGLDIIVFPDGTTSAAYDSRNLLFILPMLFGLLYYFIYSRRYNWLAKLPIGLSLGASAGFAFKGFFNEMMPQIFGSFKPLVVVAEGGISWEASLANLLFVFTLLSVMYYFFFSFKPRGVVLQKFSLSGRWLLMICFGAFFGSTVMARMALLVERLQFLIHDWWGVIRGLV